MSRERFFFHVTCFESRIYLQSAELLLLKYVSRTRRDGW